jgi:pheromone shutdown protein TraB
VVAVVGVAHVDGIERLWSEGRDVSDLDNKRGAVSYYP